MHCGLGSVASCLQCLHRGISTRCTSYVGDLYPELSTIVCFVILTQNHFVFQIYGPSDT